MYSCFTAAVAPVSTHRVPTVLTSPRGCKVHVRDVNDYSLIDSSPLIIYWIRIYCILTNNVEENDTELYCNLLYSDVVAACTTRLCILLFNEMELHVFSDHLT